MATQRTGKFEVIVVITAFAFTGACAPKKDNREAPPPRPETAAHTAEQRPVKMVRRAFSAMGTIVECTLAVREDDTGAEQALQAAFEEIQRVEALMTTFSADSPLSRLNAGSGGPPQEVPEELLAVIGLAESVSEVTAGKFDISFGAIGRLWDFRASPPELPDPDALKRALPLVDHSAIRVDRDKHTVQLAKPGMRVGLGAIAKGYAVDRASAVLKTRGYKDFIFYGGGDILVSGTKNGRPWRVGIQNPRDRSAYFAKFEMTHDGAVVTSGDYEKFFELDRKRYHHIIDPDTGYPATGTVSVTIVGPTAAKADAIATGVFVLGPEAGMKVIESDKTLEGVIVGPSLAVSVSSGLKERLQMTAIRAATKGGNP
jgi:thiamine biosynthesis lipoprotein